MNLGVDASRAVGSSTGVGRYLEYLLREWARIELPFQRVHVFSHGPTGVVPLADERFVQEILPARRAGIVWQQRRLRSAANAMDVFFAPYSAPLGLATPLVVANLGIYEGALALPGLRARLQSRHFARSARHAEAIVANSASTRDELVRHYGIDEGRVTVVWPGVDERFRPCTPRDEREGAGVVDAILGDAGQYLLFVGKLSARRNVPQLLEAFARIVAAAPGTRLLLVGPDTSGVDVPERARTLGVERVVTHVEHVDQDTLAHLYRRAAVFVLPTLAEGFSFTIPEALASGVPVVTVRHDALTEAGLDGCVVALDTPEPEPLAAAVLDLLADPAHAHRLREAGLETARGLSWEQNAGSTMRILEAARRPAAR